MQELDDVVVANDSTTSRLGKLAGGEDLPVVVGVVVRIASDLLSFEISIARR